MNVALCREDGIYQAGGQLTAKWRISRVPLDEVQAIEVSVLWHTEGKGDEDLHVHHFQRLGENQIRRIALADDQSLHCELPATPLSYHGRLISVLWCIRLRLYIASGREIVAEQPFHLVSAGSRLKATAMVAPNDSDSDADLDAGVEVVVPSARS